MAKVTDARAVRDLRKEEMFPQETAWKRRRSHEATGGWRKRLANSCASCFHRKGEHVEIFGCIEETEVGGSCHCMEFKKMPYVPK